jgi:mannitol/fructose-specific phosphotransferase system IIA component (Ntr-type)
MSTGIGLGIAIPHAKTSSVTDFVIALGRSSTGIEYDSLDGEPVHLILLIAASDTQGDEFLKLLATIGTIFNESANIKKILSAQSPESILRLLKKIEKG